MPEPGVLAVLARDEAAAEAHAAALRAARSARSARWPSCPPTTRPTSSAPRSAPWSPKASTSTCSTTAPPTAPSRPRRPWLGRGLVRIERFPDESGFDERNGDEMVWRDILRRVEQVTGEVPADWYLFVNADEFRESPWPGVTLADGLREVDELGFSAVNFELVNFRPTPQDAFVAGQRRPRGAALLRGPGPLRPAAGQGLEGPADGPVNLHHHGGHDVLFEGKRVFPVPFVLRHYPIRCAEHGRRKVLAERLGRFAAEERAGGWHVQYDHYGDDSDYLHDRETLVA